MIMCSGVDYHFFSTSSIFSSPTLIFVFRLFFVLPSFFECKALFNFITKNLNSLSHFTVNTLVYQIKLSSHSDCFTSPVRLRDKVISSPVKNKNREKDRETRQRSGRHSYGSSPQHSRCPSTHPFIHFLFNTMLSFFISRHALQATVGLLHCSILFLIFLLRSPIVINLPISSPLFPTLPRSGFLLFSPASAN